MKLPRFTLRELFLLVVIAAMGSGWWVERLRLARDLHEARTDAAILSAYWFPGDGAEHPRINEILARNKPAQRPFLGEGGWTYRQDQLP
jgi:hypothetical protein